MTAGSKTLATLADLPTGDPKRVHLDGHSLLPFSLAGAGPAERKRCHSVLNQ